MLVTGDVLESLHGVRWPSTRAVPGGAPGTHQARTRGSSAEFAEYRAYRQGEDVRRLDWKVLARTDRAFVRLAEDHAVLPTTIVVDASASMAFPVASNAKWIHAARVAVGLSSVAHATGDPAGLRITTGRTLPPRTRQGVVGDITRALAETTPAGSASLAPLLADLAGRVAILSDFLGDTEAILSQVRAARMRGAIVYAVHVADRQELDPPRRPGVVADPEALEVQRPLVAGNRAAYLSSFARWRDDLAAEFHRVGAHYVMTTSGSGGEPAARAVRRIVSGGAEPLADRFSAAAT